MTARISNSKLIVLDRDGVINQDSDQYIKSPEEFIPVPGSLEAIASLNDAGYTVVVATNQSGIARGMFDLRVLDDMHEKLQDLLAGVGGKIDRIYYCPHGPDDVCRCRKPKPGMLEQILRDYEVSPGDVYAIGDSLRDLQSAQSVGMIPMLVRTGKGQRTVQHLQDDSLLANTAVFDDLQSAVKHILNS